MEPYKSSHKDKISYWIDKDYERHIKRLKNQKEGNKGLNVPKPPKYKFFGLFRKVR